MRNKQYSTLLFRFCLPAAQGIRGLPHLTSLGLDNCGLAGSILPPGPYLSHLQVR